MIDILNKTIVLVLNRNWQAINVRTPADAFCQMATNVATALEIEGENHVRPVTWAEWITLSIRDGDNAVHTVRGAIRVPTVIVALNFAKVPNFEKNQLGLGPVFLNGLRFTSAMALLADAAVLLRARVLVGRPPSRSLLAELMPTQRSLELPIDDSTMFSLDAHQNSRNPQ